MSVQRLILPRRHLKASLPFVKFGVFRGFSLLGRIRLDFMIIWWDCPTYETDCGSKASGGFAQMRQARRCIGAFGER